MNWRLRHGSDPRWDPAFERFVSDFSAALLRNAYLLVGDRGVAEDLLQQTLLRVAGRWGVAQRAPEAYARRVLVNLCRDQHRRSMRQQTTPFAAMDAVGYVLDHSDALADRDEILTALGRLAQEHREVLVLRFFADLSVAEVAAVIGESSGTVKSRTSRALVRMRELLAEPGAVQQPERAPIEAVDDER